MRIVEDPAETSEHEKSEVSHKEFLEKRRSIEINEYPHFTTGVEVDEEADS